MARFYTSGTNSRDKTFTAMGRKNGQEAHIRGWTSGVEVIARPCKDNPDVDVFEIWQTSGSNGGPRIKIGEIIDGQFNLSELIKEGHS